MYHTFRHFIVIAVCLAVFVIGNTHIGPGYAQDDSFVPTLEPLTGTLELQGESNDDWITVDTPVELSSGDRIRTGEQDSQAVVTWFDDESLMRVEANSEVVFSDLDMPDDESIIFDMQLEQGRLLNAIIQPEDATLFYRIQTQSGTAIMVEDAVFAVDLFTDGSLAIAVAEGEVGILQEPQDDITATPVPDTVVVSGRMVIFSPNGTLSEFSLQAGLDGGDVLALVLNDFYREVLAVRDAATSN